VRSLIPSSLALSYQASIPYFVVLAAYVLALNRPRICDGSASSTLTSQPLSYGPLLTSAGFFLTTWLISMTLPVAGGRGRR